MRNSFEWLTNLTPQVKAARSTRRILSSSFYITKCSRCSLTILEEKRLSSDLQLRSTYCYCNMFLRSSSGYLGLKYFQRPAVGRYRCGNLCTFKEKCRKLSTFLHEKKSLQMILGFTWRFNFWCLFNALSLFWIHWTSFDRSVMKMLPKMNWPSQFCHAPSIR